MLLRLVLAVATAGCFVAGSMLMKPAAGFAHTTATLAVFACFALGVTLDLFLVHLRGEVGSAVVLIVGLEAAVSVVLARWLFGERVDLVRLVAVGLVLAGVALLEWRPGDGTPEASVAPGSHTGVVEPVAELGSSGDAELGVHPLQVRVDRPS
ncbi:MAG: hypothetical protein R2713_13330 [Ilumatobacteraceae bacterium]|nr:hypothetical protein [Acidimicrobiales bacterium]MCB9393426.1 hypothetical protein [Acidimicrobiaceae bacterium]